jgi:hypothetical protein
MYDGMYDKLAKHGPITGSGPGFAASVAAFNKRMERVSKVGRWRKAPCKWKRDDGTFIDPEYYIVDHGQDG